VADLGDASQELSPGGCSVKRLEQLRIDASLTPDELADQVGMAGNTIRRLEAGQRARVSTLTRLAAFFGVRASELLLDAEDAAA